VASNDEGERDNEGIVRKNLPFKGDQTGGEDDDGGDAGEAYHEGEFEALPDAGHLNPEG